MRVATSTPPGAPQTINALARRAVDFIDKEAYPASSSGARSATNPR